MLARPALVQGEPVPPVGRKVGIPGHRLGECPIGIAVAIELLEKIASEVVEAELMPVLGVRVEHGLDQRQCRARVASQSGVDDLDELIRRSAKCQECEKGPDHPGGQVMGRPPSRWR